MKCFFLHIFDQASNLSIETFFRLKLDLYLLHFISSSYVPWKKSYKQNSVCEVWISIVHWPFVVKLFDKTDLLIESMRAALVRSALEIRQNVVSDHIFSSQKMSDYCQRTKVLGALLPINRVVFFVVWLTAHWFVSLSIPSMLIRYTACILYIFATGLNPHNGITIVQ